MYVILHSSQCNFVTRVEQLKALFARYLFLKGYETEQDQQLFIQFCIFMAMVHI